jgi:hypothetical protein
MITFDHVLIYADFQLLVEIAVVDLAVPVDVDQATTHDVVYGVDVIVPHQEFHVVLQLIPVLSSNHNKYSTLQPGINSNT